MTQQNSTIYHSFCYTYQSLQTTEDFYNPNTTVSSWTDCEDKCSNNHTCKSYSFDSDGSNTCLLSSSIQSVPGSSTCFFVLKHPCEISMYNSIPDRLLKYWSLLFIYIYIFKIFRETKLSTSLSFICKIYVNATYFSFNVSDGIYSDNNTLPNWFRIISELLFTTNTTINIVWVATAVVRSIVSNRSIDITISSTLFIFIRDNGIVCHIAFIFSININSVTDIGIISFSPINISSE